MNILRDHVGPGCTSGARKRHVCYRVPDGAARAISRLTGTKSRWVIVWFARCVPYLLTAEGRRQERGYPRPPRPPRPRLTRCASHAENRSTPRKTEQHQASSLKRHHHHRPRIESSPAPAPPHAPRPRPSTPFGWDGANERCSPFDAPERGAPFARSLFSGGVFFVSLAFLTRSNLSRRLDRARQGVGREHRGPEAGPDPVVAAAGHVVLDAAAHQGQDLPVLGGHREVGRLEV